MILLRPSTCREKQADILQNFEFAAELERYAIKEQSGNHLTNLESSRREQIRTVLRNAVLRYKCGNGNRERSLVFA